MKTLIIVLLVSTYSITQAEDLILKPDGLTCSDSNTGKEYKLKHNVAVQVPNHCLDIPWTIKAFEDSKFRNDSYSKLEYRLPLSLTIKNSGKTISCYSNTKNVQRLSKYDFTIANEAIIKKQYEDGSMTSSGKYLTAEEHRKKSNQPSYQEQSLSYQIINNEIVVAEKYLNGKSPFGFYTEKSLGKIFWYMDKDESSKSINKKAFKAVKKDINFASSVDCGEEVLNESISNYGIQKNNNSSNNTEGSNSSDQ